MSVRKLMNRQKLFVDDIITVVLLGMLIYITLFNIRLAFISMAVYPGFSLIMYGIYRAYKSIFERNLKLIYRVLNISFGIACIFLSITFISFLLTNPRTPMSFSIYLLGMPILLIGLAGLLKGLIVNVYSPFLRYLNILIGATTILFSVIAINFAETSFIFHLFTLLTTLTLNGILRSALYLSEYGLQLKSFRNLKLVWFLMDNIPLQVDLLEEN